jgi:hypothetical protein
MSAAAARTIARSRRPAPAPAAAAAGELVFVLAGRAIVVADTVASAYS